MSIGVKLEDLLLAETPLQLQSHQRFGYLAAPGALIGEKEAASHLHVNRTGSLGAHTMVNIGPSRAKNADEIESGMLKKALVFHAEYGIYQHLGKLAVRENPALFPGTVK